MSIEIGEQNQNSIYQREQVQKMFNTILTAQHVISQRPQSLLLVEGKFNITTQSVNKQRHKHIVGQTKYVGRFW